MSLVKDKFSPILHESPSDFSGKEGAGREKPAGSCRVRSSRGPALYEDVLACDLTSFNHRFGTRRMRLLCLDHRPISSST